MDPRAEGGEGMLVVEIGKSAAPVERCHRDTQVQDSIDPGQRLD